MGAEGDETLVQFETFQASRTPIVTSILPHESSGYHGPNLGKGIRSHKRISLPFLYQLARRRHMSHNETGFETHIDGGLALIDAHPRLNSAKAFTPQHALLSVSYMIAFADDSAYPHSR